MYSHSIQTAKHSIFPIILTIFKNSNYVSREIAGTGFFIDEAGHFVTALHVVAAIGHPNFKFGSLGNVPHNQFEGVQPEEIVEIGRLPKLDLFVGKVVRNKLAPLEVLTVNPPEGTSIVMGGYPFPNIKKTASGGLNFYTVRQYWQSTMIMDNILLTHFDRNMPYHGFLVDKRAIPGMSGGPALDVVGNVVGMCTAQITRMAKDKVPNINGVCLDAYSLKNGIHTILEKAKKKSV